MRQNGTTLNLKEVWTERAQEAVQGAQKKFKTARQKMKVAGRKMKTAGRASTDYIEENPRKSVAISAAVGLLVGLFLNRSRRD